MKWWPLAVEAAVAYALSDDQDDDSDDDQQSWCGDNFDVSSPMPIGNG
jgi:hypothetical protein